MNKQFKDSLKLLPVRTAPFFGAGIILCAEGGVLAVILSLCAAVSAGAVFFLWRKGFASALALFLGMAVMTAFAAFVYEPILTYSDTVQRLECRITSRQQYSGYSLYHADTKIGGRSATIAFFSSEDWYEEDILTADFSLSDSGVRSYSGAGNVIIDGSIEQVINHERPEFGILRSIADFRRHLSAEVALIADEDAAALARGLLFGDTSDFSLKLRTSAKISGVMHFTSVSGAHFVIIMTILLQLIPDRNRRLRAATSIVCIPLAVMFFGAEPTVIRAGIMLLLCNFGPLLSRRSDTLNSLCVSVIAMTAFTPCVMLDIGFQMSVLGVFGAAVTGNYLSRMVRTYTYRLPKPVKLLIDGMVISAGATICIAPISVGVFGGISLTGVFATVALTPIFTAALILGVLFALTGLPALLVPLGVVIKAAYYVILFFGGDSRFWLVLNFDGAGYLALAGALFLTLAAIAPKKALHGGLTVFGVTSAAAVSLSILVTGTQRKLAFPSNGSSGAAVICMGHEAAVLISGSGAGLEGSLVSCLLDNGIYELKFIAAPDLSSAGAQSIGALCEIFPAEGLISPESTLPDILPQSKITPKRVSEIEADGLTIAAAKSGDDETAADIVLYHSYKLSEPPHGAEWLPLYVSSRQNIIPDGGINIYNEEFEIDLKQFGENYG